MYVCTVMYEHPDEIDVPAYTLAELQSEPSGKGFRVPDLQMWKDILRRYV